MGSVNRIIGFVVFFVGAWILWEGRRLPMGSLGSPGPRFFPVILAVMLMFLSLFLIAKKGEKDVAEGSFFSWPVILRRVAPVYGALIGYFLLLEHLGFVVVGLLLMIFLFGRFSSLKWYLAFAAALISIGLSSLFFGTLLKSYIPRGVFGF